MSRTRQAKYEALVRKLATIQTVCGATCNGGVAMYLTDQNVDHQNVMEGNPGLEVGSNEYWKRMYAAACMAAGMRAEQYGFDLNAAMGRSIY